jgi:hypothetical protein
MEPAVDFSDASAHHGGIAVVTGAAATIVGLSGDLGLSTAPALDLDTASLLEAHRSARD